MLKRKIRGTEAGIFKAKYKKLSRKSNNTRKDQFRHSKTKITPKMNEPSENCQPGRYVRLLNKPSVSKENKKKSKLKKTLLNKAPKKVLVKEVIGDNVTIKKACEVKLEDDEYSKILKKLCFDKPTILSGIQALFKVLEQKKDNNNQLLDLETPIFLQLSSMKVPVCPSRTLRLPLKHSLHEDDCTVCFIVSDVKNIMRKEHEKVVEHYEKLFSDKGVETKIHKILPFHELRTEYGEFEMKRKLLSTYDVFFVDGRISGFVSKHLGKIFRSKRKLPIPIGLEHSMAARMKYAMLRTSLNMHGHGNTYTVQIGHCHMTVQQIYENILSACSKLAEEFPGGWQNVKAVNLKTDLSMAIPIYLSIKNPSEIKIPRVKRRRSKVFKPVTDELSTMPHSKVTVFASGKVVVDKLSPPKKRKLDGKV